jgi:nucleoside-diphosphate-sugar epimerase
MRVLVTGATGNVGTSLLRLLEADARVTEIVGLARRPGASESPKTTWVSADVGADPLEPLLRGMDAVVHLAWVIQPSRDEDELERVNVTGSRRVFEAAAAAGVGKLVYASSIGAYSPGPKDRGVRETWPTDGVPSAWYSRHKSAVEQILDDVEAANPAMRVVRLRPGLIFKGESAEEIRRYFAGPFLPSPLVHPRFLRVVPSMPRLRVQAVHADDVAEAYRLAVLDPSARGAYNVAADPVIDPDVLARELRAVKLRLPVRPVRALVDLTWKARLQPTPPGWLDMGLGVPLMDTSRIRTELGWEPRVTAVDALRELLDGMSRRQAGPTPVLSAEVSGPARSREVGTGVGGRNP